MDCVQMERRRETWHAASIVIGIKKMDRVQMDRGMLLQSLLES